MIEVIQTINVTKNIGTTWIMGWSLDFVLLSLKKNIWQNWPAPLCTRLLNIIGFDNTMLEEASDTSSPVPGG